MHRAVTRLIGTGFFVVLSAGIALGGITAAGNRKPALPRGAGGANGIHELLDFIYDCRDCDGDRERRGGMNHLDFAGAGGIYASLVIELASAANSTHRIWLATRPDGAGILTPNIGPAELPPSGSAGEQAPRTIAYLGGVPESFVSSAAEAFRGRGGNPGRGQGGGSQGFGHKPDSLAAVPEPAPIFLLGTILLATFSIARLRFNR